MSDQQLPHLGIDDANAARDRIDELFEEINKQAIAGRMGELLQMLRKEIDTVISASRAAGLEQALPLIPQLGRAVWEDMYKGKHDIRREPSVMSQAKVDI